MMNPKEFFRRWKQGMKELTPTQMVHSQVVGYGGAVIGLSIAFLALVYRTITNFNFVQLGFAIFIIFLIWLQTINFISSRQKYKTIKEVEDKMELNRVIKELEG